MVNFETLDKNWEIIELCKILLFYGKGSLRKKTFGWIKSTIRGGGGFRPSPLFTFFFYF